MTDCDYIETQGYKKKLNNNSFNNNDVQGIIVLTLVLTIIYLSYCQTEKKSSNKSNNKFIILFTSLLCIFIYLRQIRIVYMFSFIITLFTRTPPFLDKKEFFPNYILFENEFYNIKQEVVNLLNKTNGGKEIGFTKDTFDKKENSYIGQDVDIKLNRGWRVFHVKLSKHYNNDALKIFPSLCSVLKQIPEVINCSVSILDEKTFIPIHNGYYKGMLRFMLPIIIPKDYTNVFLCNNYEKYYWKEGVGVLWDDTFPHKVFNHTNEVRVVLYMDIIRPIPGLLGYLNNGLINLLGNSTMIKDEIKKTEKKIKL